MSLSSRFRYKNGQAKKIMPFKHIFGSAAQQANQSSGNFFKGYVGWDVRVRVTFFRIVDVTTDGAFIFCIVPSSR
jgi:hypothetical protein